MDDDFLEKYIRDELHNSFKNHYVRKKDYMDAVNKYMNSPTWMDNLRIPSEKEIALDELFGVNK
jgi:hypothetical protein